MGSKWCQMKSSAVILSNRRLHGPAASAGRSKRALRLVARSLGVAVGDAQARAQLPLRDHPSAIPRGPSGPSGDVSERLLSAARFGPRAGALAQRVRRPVADPGVGPVGQPGRHICRGEGEGGLQLGPKANNQAAPVPAGPGPPPPRGMSMRVWQGSQRTRGG